MSLYHYTDLNAVYSILKSGKLRFTDIRYLNDSEELNNGINIIRDLLEKTELNSFSREPAEFEFKSTFNLALYNIQISEIFINPIYVCSFSKAEDLLSQWRSYGLFSIEFNEEELFKHLPRMIPCVYDDETKTETAKELLFETAKATKSPYSVNEPNFGPEYNSCIMNVIEQVASFKHGGFSEEQEIRSYTQLFDVKTEKLFRTKSNILIPYIEVDIPLECINAIQIGPVENKQLTKFSLMEFVQDIGKTIQIKESKIPFRTL